MIKIDKLHEKWKIGKNEIIGRKLEENDKWEKSRIIGKNGNK
jgi:hypothetical protein